ncbi:MAG: peptidylprolyl isomerase [Rhodobacteraceae bacterium]|nr:peptidylprolyl isomerase [Paracoccaceae bacterium]
MVSRIRRLTIAFLMVLGFSAAVAAQNAYSAAYRVNESIISYFDIDQRVKLMRVLGANGPNLRQTAIDGLIDDRLKVNAAQNFGLEIQPERLIRAMSDYATQRDMSLDQLLARLRGRGVSREAFEDFIMASLMWRTVLQSRFGDQATPSEIDLNAQLNTVAVSSSSSIQIGEIALLYSERGQDATVTLANQLVRQLRDGANFQNMAREYSRSRSATNGGVIGWVAPGRLPPQLAAAIRGLGRGQVAEPIFIPTGIIIIRVLDSRTQQRQVLIPTKIDVTYAQLILGHAAGDQANALTQADRLRRSLDGCRGLDAQATNFADGSRIIGPIGLGEIPAPSGKAKSAVMLPKRNWTRIVPRF